MQMRAINAPMRKRYLIHVEGTKRGTKKKNLKQHWQKVDIRYDRMAEKNTCGQH